MISRFYQARFRLWQISRRLGFKLYPWQRDFALGRTNFLDYPPGRGTGKTTAVMLRLLLMDRADDEEAACILACDPDWKIGMIKRPDWYETEYNRLRGCLGPGPNINFVKITSKWRQKGTRGKLVRFKTFYTGDVLFRCSVCGGVCDEPPFHSNRWHTVTGIWGERNEN